MATIQSTLKFNDKMSSTLSSVTRAMQSTLSVMEASDKGVGNLSKSIQKARQDLNAATRDIDDFTKHTKDMGNQSNTTNNQLLGMLGRIVSYAAAIKGINILGGLSDQYTQTHARLGMITNDVDGLENKIHNAAQTSRVSYQSLADTVSKLGMQAGAAFNNSTDEVLAFSELLTKTFTASGLDSNAINSVMYNITQSLSSGKLLGQDYRILKQNAPQILAYLKQFYGDISQAELDALVSAGKVSAQDLKLALFKASDDINNRFNQMPVTFGQAWTKMKNSALKISKPILKILSVLANGLDGLFTFLAEHEYILYLIATGFAVMAGALLIYQAEQTITTTKQMILNSAMGTTIAIIALVATAILILVGVLLYFWNTNDEFAEAVLWAWDTLKVGMMIVATGIEGAWYGILYGIESVIGLILSAIQDMVNTAIGMVNGLIELANKLPKVHIDTIGEVTFADDYSNWASGKQAERAQRLDTAWATIEDTYNTQNATRSDRVANRKKFGYNSSGGTDEIADLLSGLNTTADDLVGSDGNGGKALKTTSDDKLFDNEDIQLLLDIATRDYKLNYQQITPNITVTFGDVRETADVDLVMEQVATRLEEIYDGNLEVSN